jgi:hypothetical protein
MSAENSRGLIDYLTSSSFNKYFLSMKKKIKKPKRRVPLPKKTEKVHKDRSKYTNIKKTRKNLNKPVPVSTAIVKIYNPLLTSTYFSIY